MIVATARDPARTLDRLMALIENVGKTGEVAQLIELGFMETRDILRAKAAADRVSFEDQPWCGIQSLFGLPVKVTALSDVINLVTDWNTHNGIV